MDVAGESAKTINMISLNKYILISGNTKMADVIFQNPTLLTVLPRFGIKLGFGEKTVSKICEDYTIDEHIFILICNIHTFDNYAPSDDELENINIKSIIKYLDASHSYYVKKRIYEIEMRLRSMNEHNSGNRYKIINTFFCEYKLEIINHFTYEEKVVFPYVDQITSGMAPLEFHIDKYEENHDSIDDKLSDLKSIIIKYLPEEDSSDEIDDRNGILREIFLFEDDISKHTRIEDRVLIPIVKKIEQRYEQK